MKQSPSIFSEIFEEFVFKKEELDLLESSFEKMNVKKGEIILQVNNIVYDQYYVYKGCLRSFFTDNLGKEHTVQFAIKDWWITDHTAFFSTSKAIMSIECIKDATIYKISKENIDNLYLKIPLLETFFRKKLENGFAAFQKRILSNLSQTAKQKYISFVNKYPEIEQCVKNYHVASYLGITSESLSRIRKELRQK